MFISITFTETSIDKTNKIHQTHRFKICVQNFRYSHEHVHSHDYATTQSLYRDDGVVQQPPLPQQMFLELIHIMDTQR